MFDIELTGSFLIAGIFILSLLNINAQVMEANTINNMNVSAQENAVGIAQMLRQDLYKIGFGLSSPETSITACNDSGITFIADIDQNGIPDTVSYRLGSRNEVVETENINDRFLYRSVNGVEHDVAIGLSSFNVSVSDAQKNPAASLSDVRIITLSFTVETPFYFGDKTGRAEWKGSIVPNNLRTL